MPEPLLKESAPGGDLRLEDRVVFGPTMETLLLSCGDPPHPAAVEAFLEAGVDVRRLEVAYPLQTYLVLLDRVRRIRFPELPEAEGYYRLGRSFIERYSSTFMGRATLRLLPILGPVRVLAKMAQSFRSASNYVRVQAKELGPRHYEVHLGPVRRPHYYHGVLAAGLEVTGARGLAVKLLEYRANEEVVFEVRWTA